MHIGGGQLLVALAFGEPPTLERPYGLPRTAGGPTAELKRDRGQRDHPLVLLVTAHLGTDVSDAAGVRLAVVALGPFGGRWLFLKFTTGPACASKVDPSARVARPSCSSLDRAARHSTGLLAATRSWRRDAG